MQTGSKIQISLFLAMAAWNVIMAVFGDHDTIKYVTVAILFVGWAVQIRITDDWRARALKAEGSVLR